MNHHQSVQWGSRGVFILYLANYSNTVVTLTGLRVVSVTHAQPLTILDFLSKAAPKWDAINEREWSKKMIRRYAKEGFPR
jgi:hypothetical protein